MKNLFLASASMACMVLFASTSAQAQPNAEEVKICLETVQAMSEGKPSKAAVSLCKQGKMDEAIDKAMSSM
jgi:hypothetical protein